MAEDTQKFDPFAVLEKHIEGANEHRYRIIAWRMNHAAQVAVVASRQYSEIARANPLQSVADTPLLGIDVVQYTDDRQYADEPLIEPVFEKVGKAVLVHDYEGEIEHGSNRGIGGKFG